MISSLDERAVFERFEALWKRYEQTSAELVRTVESGRPPDALAQLSNADTLKLYSELGTVLAQDVTLNREGGQRDADAGVTAPRWPRTSPSPSPFYSRSAR